MSKNQSAKKPSQKKADPKPVKADLDVGDVPVSKQLSELENEILEEAIKITKNEVSSCYDLVSKTKELLKIRSAQV